MSGKTHTASRLKHRLTLQQEVHTADTAGGYVRSWEEVAKVWAEILPVSTTLSGRLGETLMAQRIQSAVTHRILMRYRAGLDSSMRLVFENRVFNIRTIVNRDETNEVLELLVEEGVAG